MAKIKETLAKSSSLRALLVLCGAITFYMLLQNFQVVRAAFGFIFNILAPLVVGFIIAYLLDPIVSFVEKKVLGGIKRRRAARRLGVTITLVLVFSVLGLLIAITVPQLMASVKFLLSNIDNYLASFIATVKEWLATIAIDGVPIELPPMEVPSWLENMQLGNATKTIMDWCVQHQDGILGASYNAGSGVLKGALAVLFSIYILLDKQGILRSFKRCIKSAISTEAYNRLSELGQRSNRIFLRFFAANLLDSLIIGVACYLFMLILGLPYSILVTIIVAVTNLIPTFGPIVGAMICALLILLLEPMGAVWFLLYTVVSQMADSSVIKPLLFGDTMNLRPLWVLAAVIIGGGLFGVMGMFLGIPAAALLSTIIEERVTERLSAKGYDEEGRRPEEMPEDGVESGETE